MTESSEVLWEGWSRYELFGGNEHDSGWLLFKNCGISFQENFKRFDNDQDMTVSEVSKQLYSWRRQPGEWLLFFCFRISKILTEFSTLNRVTDTYLLPPLPGGRSCPMVFIFEKLQGNSKHRKVSPGFTGWTDFPPRWTRGEVNNLPPRPMILDYIPLHMIMCSNMIVSECHVCTPLYYTSSTSLRFSLLSLDDKNGGDGKKSRMELCGQRIEKKKPRKVPKSGTVDVYIGHSCRSGIVVYAVFE